MLSRPRRNRRSEAIRLVAKETWLTPQHFVLPLFIHGGEGCVDISSMPGCRRLDEKGLFEEVEGAVADGIRGVVLFPAEEEKVKTPGGEECFNADGLVQRRVRALKARWPELLVVTDVALDPYNSDGHDGIVDKKTGHVLNDETVAVLCKQALSHARAGADMISPSDMMGALSARAEVKRARGGKHD